MSEHFGERRPEENREQVTQGEVESFLDDLEKYDKDHSYGAWMGRALAAELLSQIDAAAEEKKDQWDEEPSGLEKMQEEISKNLKLQDILDRHQNTLEKLGIDLESPNPNGDFDEQETYAVGDMKIDFTDQEKFVNYLKSLDEKSLSSAELKLAELVLKKVLDRVKQEYRFDSADDRLLELFSGIRDLVVESRRLGLEEEASELERCVNYNQQKALSAYIFARNREFLEPIGKGFNWSTYQIDSSPESYIGYWDRAFEALDNAKQHKNGAQLYKDILTYAQSCLDFAEKDSRWEKYNDVKDFREAMGVIRKKLQNYAQKINA